MSLRMIERVANLAGNILQVPDGEAIVAGQRGGDGVALNVFGGRQKFAVFFADAVKHGNVVAAQRLGLVGFFENASSAARRRLSPRSVHHLERNRLLILSVQRFVDGRTWATARAGLRVRNVRFYPASYVDPSNSAGLLSHMWYETLRK